MIKEIEITNFKSIEKIKLKLGRITVFIGENGSGKSNILESIAFAASASANKLDNSYLVSRGVRDTDASWMLPAFINEQEQPQRPQIAFSIKGSAPSSQFECEIAALKNTEDNSFSKWIAVPKSSKGPNQEIEDKILETGKDKAREALKKLIELTENDKNEKFESSATDFLLENPVPAMAGLISMLIQMSSNQKFAKTENCADFMIYAPENAMLRTPLAEGMAQPVGTKGEGLFRLVQTFADPKFADRLSDMKQRLRIFGWFEDFIVPDDTDVNNAKLNIRDKWISSEKPPFDQRSANEGFLYLLFYFSILMSWRTPNFFAIDNVDNALNPRLCSEIISQIHELSSKYEKQVICTTHNPAILDGLDLSDDTQRLYTVRRNSKGRTIVRRVNPPSLKPGETPIRLSEAFMRGIIGGLPEHF